MDVAIRTATEDDFFTLWERIDWRGLPRERDSIYLLAVTHQAPFCYFAEVEGDLAGVLVGNVAANRERAYVQHLVVAEPFEGRGIGTRLLERFEQDCREAGVKTIWLFGSAGLYRRLGYTYREDFFSPRLMHYIRREKAGALLVKDL